MFSMAMVKIMTRVIYQNITKIALKMRGEISTTIIYQILEKVRLLHRTFWHNYFIILTSW